MAYEHKESTGSLFQNNKKQTENQPDFTGTALIDGKLRDVSLWIKKAKSGIEYFNLAFRDKKEKDSNPF
jgi:hypothetical protein